jgi:ABC-2 type transport system permease protein
MNFWQRNLAAFKLAWIQQLEYRLNLFVDAILQPTMTACVEIGLWYVMISSIGSGDALGGFPRIYYLHYALWAAFFARISSNWMYETRMVDEIQAGAVNVILTRPLSFYEFYLSQFISYKILTSILSLMIPVIVVTLFLPGPTDLTRLPLACFVVLINLFFIYGLSFIVVCAAFKLTRVHAITYAKNFAIWSLSGELFPIDLAPPALREFLLSLPFVSGVYLPVGYLTGRINAEIVYAGIIKVILGIVVAGLAGNFFWRRGLRSYVGTGA